MPVFQLTDSPYFPPPDLARADGLLAVGGDLSAERLLIAYQMGIFPWYSEKEPILWWAPSPRLVLFPDEFKISKRLARTIRQGGIQVTMDQDFRQVIERCAEIPRAQSEGTWITREMIEAFCVLYDLGFCHSVECRQAGELVGGLYGVSIGSIFYGESMFSSVTNGSKIALATLVPQLIKWDFDLIDCQIPTEHLKSMGAREISGNEFYARLEKCILRPTRQGKWSVEA